MRLALCFALVCVAAAQEPLTDRAALALAGRVVELMDAQSLASPEMGRAGQPLTENARQAYEVIRANSSPPPAAWHRLIDSLRAFLLVADAIPRATVAPEESRRQMAELREAILQLDVYFAAFLDRLYGQLTSPDRDNLSRYRDLNTRLSPPDPARPRVVFLGDSITDSWRLNEYFAGQDFHNRGISGQVTSQMLGRFQSDVAALKPAAVVVLAGTNDIARGTPLPVIQAYLTSIADLADHYRIKVILAGVLPVSDYHKLTDPRFERTRQRPPQVILALNDWIRELCAKRGYTFLNYWPVLADERSMLKAELAADGLHPDAPAYRLMAPLALEAIQKALGLPKPSAPRPRR